TSASVVAASSPATPASNRSASMSPAAYSSFRNSVARCWASSRMTRPGSRRAAAGAQAEQFHGVVDGREPGLGRHLVGPLLHGPPLDLHAGAARPADQVMVVGLAAAPPVQGLPAGFADGVYLAVLAQHLQVPVDGGEADPLTPAAQLGMDLLRAPEAGQAGQDRGQRLGLPGSAHPRPPAPGGAGWSAHCLLAVAVDS